MSDGWVYFIQGGAHIKIGWSPDPDKRLRTLSVGNPFPLVLLAKFPGSVRDEKLLHRLLKPYKARADGEWFHARKPVLALVDWATRHGATPEHEVADARSRSLELALRNSQSEVLTWKGLAESWRNTAESRGAASSPGQEAVEALGKVEALERAFCRLCVEVHKARQAIFSALEGHSHELVRAIDATDDHDGLSDVIRAAHEELVDLVSIPIHTLDRASHEMAQLANVLDEEEKQAEQQQAEDDADWADEPEEPPA